MRHLVACAFLVAACSESAIPGGGMPDLVAAPSHCGVVHGRKRVDLNFYPPSGNVMAGLWTGDGANLMRNALLYQ
jgi:hypothetical protein